MAYAMLTISKKAPVPLHRLFFFQKNKNNYYSYHEDNVSLQFRLKYTSIKKLCGGV